MANLKSNDDVSLALTLFEITGYQCEFSCILICIGLDFDKTCFWQQVCEGWYRLEVVGPLRPSKGQTDAYRWVGLASKLNNCPCCICIFTHYIRYEVVIMTNQGAVSLKSDSKTLKIDRKRLAEFKSKVTSVMDQLDIPISVYAATDKDKFRKPRVGMWKEMLDDQDLDEGCLDLSNSIFVGDAGGRQGTHRHPKDHSCSDRYVLDYESNQLKSILWVAATLPPISVLLSRHQKSFSSTILQKLLHEILNLAITLLLVQVRTSNIAHCRHSHGRLQHLSKRRIFLKSFYYVAARQQGNPPSTGTFYNL